VFRRRRKAPERPLTHLRATDLPDRPCLRDPMELRRGRTLESGVHVHDRVLS
jgi:hypothetical protein